MDEEQLKEAKVALWEEIKQNLPQFLTWINCKTAESILKTNANEMTIENDLTLDGKRYYIKTVYTLTELP